jgi:hypothetical protein
MRLASSSCAARHTVIALAPTTTNAIRRRSATPDKMGCRRIRVTHPG